MLQAVTPWPNGRPITHQRVAVSVRDGTNAHAIVEEEEKLSAPESSLGDAGVWARGLFMLSSTSSDAPARRPN